MDENTYLGPPAQVTWVKGCSVGAEDRDSGSKLGEKPVISETPSTSSAVNEDQPEPEISSAPEPVKPEPVVQMIEKPAQSEKVIVRKSMSFVEEFRHINISKCLQSDACSEATLSEGSWSPREPRQQMVRLLLEDMASDKKIFNCVKEKLDRSQVSSSPYLRELMTAVCKAAVKENTNCRVHAALLQKRMPVTLQYRNSESERQLQALQGLQALIFTLDRPPNLLRIFFHCMYDKDVSSEDAFCKMGMRKEPADQLGNGVALKTLTAFFTWLREAESQDN